MPVTIGHYWLSDSGTFPLTMVLVGGLVAGYLAKQTATPAARTGFVAGVVGTLPGVLLFIPALYETIAEWIEANAIIPTLIAIPLIGLVIFGGAGLLGYIGGRIGGWVATEVGTTETTPPT